MDFSEKLFWKLVAGAGGFLVGGPAGAYVAAKAVSVAVSGPIALIPLGGAADMLSDFAAAGSDLVSDAVTSSGSDLALSTTTDVVTSDGTHALTIFGGPEDVNGHGNPPTDVWGNEPGRTIHGTRPTDIQGHPYG